MTVRRVVDAAIAAIGLLLLAVPLALAAALVKLTSRGPVLYRQQRIGHGGRPFSLYKLRTMRIGAGGTQVTITDDARITTVGRLLRRFKIDELPQLWNIVKGEMALIGPRPEVERFVARYDTEQRRILSTTPGLAGRAQLVYPHEADFLRDAFDPEEAYVAELMPKKIAVDLEYERRRTLWTDLVLVFDIALLVAGVRRGVAQDIQVVRRRTAATTIAPPNTIHH